MKRNSKFLLLLTFCSLVIPSSFIDTNLDNSHLEEKVILKEAPRYKENKQVYLTNENETHTIYWAQGIDFPLMPEDPNDLGKPGYFELDDTVKGYEVYQAGYEDNKGYFDYNKDMEARPNESSHCYLGSSANLISWWLEQNKEYVTRYLTLLKNSDVFMNEEGLVQTLPFNENMWKEIYTIKSDGKAGNLTTPLIYDSLLIRKYLTPYYLKTDDGYFPDRVLDYFFNGYEAISNDGFPNDENNFHKDRTGGYFYNIFGKTRLSNRDSKATFAHYNELIKDSLNNGYGLNLSYLTNAEAHALTIWGAEYDENGQIVRIYISDTDDYSNWLLSDKTKARSIVGMNTRNDNGIMRLSNSTSPTHKGAQVNAIITLSLAQEEFEASLNDLTDPAIPEIESISEGRTLAIGTDYSLEVKAKSLDKGYLDYEWFVSEEKGVKGEKIKNETLNSLKIDTSKPGTFYYIVDVINKKHGKRGIKSSNQIEIIVKDVPLVNAETPIIDFGYGSITRDQYSIFELRLRKAQVNDGGTLTYQWYEANSSMTNDNPRKLIGETRSSLYVDTSKPGRRFYFCEVTNTNNSEKVTGLNVAKARTPHARPVIVNEAELINAQRPILLSQKTSYDVEENGSVDLEFESKTIDGGKLSYEWYEVLDNQNVLIPNENEKTLKLSNLKPGNHRYVCKIINTNELAKENKTNYLLTNDFIVNVKGDYVPSSDSTLKTLTLKNATLNVPFDSNVLNYEVDVHVNVDKIILEAIPNDSKATIEITNPILEIGENEILIKVIAEDKTNTIYKIKVNKGSTHDFGEIIIDIPPTCLNEGKGHKVCSTCGEIIEVTIEPKGHNWDDKFIVDKEPTCHEEGEKSIHCLDCDERKEITSIPKLSHDFGEWEVKIEPTYEKDGLEIRTCKLCGDVEERLIPKLEKPIDPIDPDKPEVPEVDDNENNLEVPEEPNNLNMIIGLSATFGTMFVVTIIIFLVLRFHKFK